MRYTLNRTMRYTLDESKTIGRLGRTLLNVLDNGVTTEAYAKQGVKFSDECEIRGGEFHSGWLILQIQGSKHFVNIPDGVNIRIGCQCHDVEYWLRNFERIGKIERYSDAEIAEYKAYIDIAVKMIKSNK